nr:immunoglobulin heavy chain junction region [Homo sapiens]
PRPGHHLSRQVH